MGINDPIGDMITRIRNGQRAQKAKVVTPASSLRLRVLEVLKKEGYIRDFNFYTLSPGISEISIELKYVDGEPVIQKIGRVSVPGRRTYSKIKKLAKVYNGLGISILSTPKGIISDAEARALNVGGEVLCHVF